MTSTSKSATAKTQVQFRVDGTLRTWENWTQREGELFFVGRLVTH